MSAAHGWQDRRVLVTGAGGIVGSWVVRALLDQGASVVALVLDLDPSSAFVRSGDAARVTKVYGGLEDYAAVDRAIGGCEVDTVIHLAAQALVGTAMRAPLTTFEANVRGTYHVLDACRTHASTVTSVVVASSDKAYGSSDTLPYVETTPLRPTHPYDVSKACTDLIALSYHVSFGLPVNVARCGNIYGGGDLNWSRIVPGTIRALARGEAPVIRSDGRYVRDYLYVKDAASAYLRLAEAARGGQAGDAYNVSGDARRTVLEVVDALRGLMGRQDILPDVQNTARNEIREQWLDASKVRTTLGWAPTHTLEQGLQETVAWYRDLFGATGRP